MPRPKQRLKDLIEAFTGRLEPATTEGDLVRAPPPSATVALERILARWPAAASPGDEAPIFILSVGWRSGSTLLQRMIMASGQALVWGEPWHRSDIVQGLRAQLGPFGTGWPPDHYIAPDASSDAPREEWIANLFPPFESLREAHRAFLDRLLCAPARERGYPRWGLKEVRLTVDDARYLRWIYPHAQFLFIVRNPYDAWRSYRRWRDWYFRWPGRPVGTPWAFGRLWRRLAGDFADHHAAVDGLLVRYEDLAAEATIERIAGLLRLPVAPVASLPVASSRGVARRSEGAVPAIERRLLALAVGGSAARFGYAAPHRAD